ncbi:hypothetical protein DBK22_03842 [Bacillus velezensis]|nr:hypothetical protein DBK22_03842 [Bacillus velezensis]
MIFPVIQMYLGHHRETLFQLNIRPLLNIPRLASVSLFLRSDYKKLILLISLEGNYTRLHFLKEMTREKDHENSQK